MKIQRNRWAIILLLLLLPLHSALAQANSADEIQPLDVGKQVPAANLKNIDGQLLDLKSVLGGKPGIVIFFRGGWCPYCNLHLAELQTIEAQLLEMGFQIIALSPDSAERLKASVDKHKLSYQLYSDPGLNAAIAFGIAFKVDQSGYSNLLSYGVDIEKESGEKHRLLPVPAAFVVDGEGVIRFRYANPDYKVRVGAEQLLAEAKKIKK